MDATRRAPSALARRALAALVLPVVIVVAIVTVVLLDARNDDAGTARSTMPTPPYGSYDQWLDLRGGLPKIITGMTPPDRAPHILERLLPRRPPGGGRRIYRDRPAGYEPVSIVLHATGSGEPNSGFATLDEAWRFFARPGSRTSAHFVVDREGQVLRMVDELEHAAFHTATPGWNDVSIGVELLNDNSGSEPYPGDQLTALTHLVRALGVTHGIPVEAVVRHATIQPVDRRDPVGFPWRSWLRTLHA